MGEWFRWSGSRPEPFQGRVALEGLSERHAALGAELVVAEPAYAATGRVRRSKYSEVCMMCGLKAWARVDSMAGQQT